GGRGDFGEQRGGHGFSGERGEVVGKAPSTKLQRNFKSQIPSSIKIPIPHLQSDSAGGDCFWSLGLGVSLEPGAWDLEVIHTSRFVSLRRATRRPCISSTRSSQGPMARASPTLGNPPRRWVTQPLAVVRPSSCSGPP